MYTTLKFNADKVHKIMKAEASMLAGFMDYGMVQVFPDNVTGFELKSHKTERTSTWVLRARVVHGSYVKEWVFAPSIKTEEWMPELSGWTIRITNE